MSFIPALNKPLLALIAACSLISCSSTQHYPVDERYQSENYNSRIQFLVMHFTAINWERSLFALTDGKQQRRVSSHYLIPESLDPTYPHQQLKVFRLVPEHLRAWHAGVSRWENRSGLNDQSIGIELVNTSWCYPAPLGDTKREDLCVYKDYDEQQIQLLIELSKDILARNSEITPTRVIGHSDIQPHIKVDPGPRFPWQRLYQEGIGAWFDDDVMYKYWQQFTENEPQRELFFRLLREYGYGIEADNPYQQYQVTKAFQMHFRPHQVNGQPDAESAAILWALMEKYFPEKLQRALQEAASPVIAPITVG